MYRLQDRKNHLLTIVVLVIVLTACGSEDKESAKSTMTEKIKGPESAQSYLVEANPGPSGQESGVDSEPGLDEGVSASSGVAPDLQLELEQARQSLEMARDQNKDLNSRIQRLEEMFQEQERMMEQQDKKLSEMKQRMESNTEGE